MKQAPADAEALWRPDMLDPVVLSALIDNDESLGVLDELTVVRASLEAAMAGLADHAEPAAEARALLAGSGPARPRRG
ncbi:hypothetical protein [Kribbella speibonae]|uniref:hypothetical protein n=1 Tax=Kribbella speibonae TaxID=1572660 RepID=UPI00192D9191|nr:hypothetical protein [Kribbella speibonae]